MATYTTQVRSICESYADLDESMGFDNMDEIIKKAIPKVFNFDFPIFDESYRNILCYKILDQNYTKEIGAETVGLWKHYLKSRLNEIMPYYNQLYKSQLLEFNPFYETDLSKEYTKTLDGTEKKTDNEIVSGSNSTNGITNSLNVANGSNTTNDTTTLNGVSTRKSEFDKVLSDSETEDNTSNVTGESTSDTTNENESKTVGTKWNLLNDTPQGSIQNIDNESYLTSATKNTDNTKVNDTGETNNTINTESETTETKERVNDVTEESTTNDRVEDNNKTIQDITESSTNRVNIDSSNSQHGIHSNNSNSTSNGEINNLETYFEKIKGKASSTSYSKLLNEFRSTFLNIDKMILDDLFDLFMLIW